MVPVTGGVARIVYESPYLFIGDWTGDGAALIVTKMVDVTRAEVGIVDIANGRYRRLTDGRGVSSINTAATHPVALYAQWIPDAPSRSELRILSTKDGGTSVLLTGADDFAPAWSPKEDAVIFASNRNGRRGIWSIGVREGRSAGAPRLLHELDEDLSLIGLTSDGTAYLEGFGTAPMTYVARVTWPGGRVSTPAAISTPRFLGARRPTFSPDGRFLATVLRTAAGGVRPGWQMPLITELATGRQWTFPSELTIRDEVGWLPDGQSLIAINDEATNHGDGSLLWTFWSLSLADRSATRLGQVRAAGLTVRLVGITDREVVYRRNVLSPPSSYLETFDLRTRSTREFYHTSEEITDASLSPDGRQVAMAVRSAEGADIYVLRAGEPTPSKLALSNFRPNSRPQVMWVATQDGVILTGAFSQQQGTWLVPLNGDAPQRLELSVADLTEARLSPDGQTVAYTVHPRVTRELWMLRGAIK